jgi:hypothetical protein
VVETSFIHHHIVLHAMPEYTKEHQQSTEQFLRFVVDNLLSEYTFAHFCNSYYTFYACFSKRGPIPEHATTAHHNNCQPSEPVSNKFRLFFSFSKTYINSSKLS